MTVNPYQWIQINQVREFSKIALFAQLTEVLEKDLWPFDENSDSESDKECENFIERAEYIYERFLDYEGVFDFKKLIEDKYLTFIQSLRVIKKWTKTKNYNGN